MKNTDATWLVFGKILVRYLMAILIGYLLSFLAFRLEKWDTSDGVSSKYVMRTFPFSHSFSIGESPKGNTDWERKDTVGFWGFFSAAPFKNRQGVQNNAEGSVQ